jgi:drug/metabolite transporter (DMT)-like permease
MPLRSATLVLFSAFLHAVWNAMVKREKDPRSAGAAVLTVAAIAAAAAALAGSAPAFPHRAGVGWAALAGVFEGGYFAALGLALAHGSLGTVYTVARGGAMLVAWPISIVCLGESFPLVAKLGVAVIGLGLALTAARPGEAATRGSLAWAAICAACIGGYHVCYKLALEGRADPRALFAVALACALPINFLWLGKKGTRAAWLTFRARPGRLALGGLTCTASFLTFLVALDGAGAGTVLTMRNTSIVFAQLLAVSAGERPRRLAVVGAALVVGGAFLLAR